MVLLLAIIIEDLGLLLVLGGLETRIDGAARCPVELLDNRRATWENVDCAEEATLSIKASYGYDGGRTPDACVPKVGCIILPRCSREQE